MKGETYDYRPLSFWSWNGEMENEEVRCQIRQFAEQGYGGFFIHARAGLSIEYMGDEWFEACRIAIEEAERLQLSVWLYDENGWPSGFASGKVNGLGEAYQAKKLVFTENYIEDNDNYRFLAAYRKCEGVFVRCELKDPEASLFCGYELVEHYADVLCKEVVGRFIQVTHQVYYDRFKTYFGTVIQGVFTDEPQTMFPAWSLVLEDAYTEKWNRDILDELWMLKKDVGDYKAFRYRYFATVSELYVENFTKQIHTWCEAHDVSLTGHFPNEDGAYMQVKQNGGVMPNYPYMGVPGIDFLGRRYPSQVLLSQVSSVARQIGKRQVLSESYGCAGWDISFQELMSIAAYQAVMGVNTLCTHISAYTIWGRRKRDYPAFYSYQEPWWEQFSLVSEYIKTVNEILSGMKKFTHIAVLHPLRSIWCNMCVDEDAQGTANVGAGAAESTEFRRLVELLHDLQIEFDLIDDDMMTNMECKNGVIHNQYVSYDTLILPHMNSICEQTRSYISEFGKQGGSVLVVDGLPQLIEGANPQVDKNGSVAILDCPYTEVYNSHNLLLKQFAAMQYKRECMLLDANGLNPIRGLILNYGETDNGDRVCFVFNHSDGNISSTIRQAGNWVPYIYDCAHGQMEEIPYTVDGTYTYAKVSASPKEGKMIRFCSKAEEAQNVFVEECMHKVTKIDVTCTDENAWNIDYASYRIGDEEWSEVLPIVHMSDDIYRHQNLNNQSLQVRYCFEAEYLPKQLHLAIENVNGVQVMVNNISISPQEDWWLDKKISRYDISKVARIGENVVVLTYLMETEEQYINLSERFECERNRFSYQIEPESIYLLGKFDVAVDIEPQAAVEHILLRGDTQFRMVAPSEKKLGELTCQGLWFYRGSVDYTFELLYHGNNRVRVTPKDWNGTALDITVNGINSGTYTGVEPIEITQWLSKGNNTIVLTVLGHNRNLLGPHHHKKHNPIFVGPSTFNGRKGFEDFVNPELLTEDTWTDDYSFVPFGCGAIEIAEME